MTDVKICGISTPDALNAAVSAGARYAGFVFHAGSKRAVSRENAAQLIRMLPATCRAVGLFVDADDETMDHVLSHAGVDMIQLHGNETALRARAIRARYNRPVIKALSVATAADLADLPLWNDVADMVLFDARAAGGAFGGTGRTFDWALLDGAALPAAWMLAGGLTPDNIGAALARLRPPIVDVSSGVEDAPGQKSVAKITTFIENVKAWDSNPIF